MDENELSDGSDTSDEDYDPGAKPEEVVSEEDSDGDVEEPLLDAENVTTSRKKRRNAKKGSNNKKLKVESQEKDEEETPKEELTEEEKKKQVDALWADFLQDTGFKSKKSILKDNHPANPKKESTSKPEVPTKSNSNSIKKNEPEKIKITKVFEFAGEEVRVEEEVAKDSAEARLLGNSSNSVCKTKKGGSLSGIGSVLSQLGKKKKISTLEKTKLDWNQYKKDENLEEELTAYNKGKDGYLERQDFLERADLRQFEIEKEQRNVERSKRMNMGGPL